MNNQHSSFCRFSALLALLFSLGTAAAQADTAIASVPITITVPGRYFLAMNLNSNNASRNAITVDADDVTIDFQDHTISGLGAGTGTSANGVAATNHRNITIKNGTLTGFKVGVLLQRGLNITSNNANNIVENMRLVANTFGGVLIDSGAGCRIEQCQINRTGGTFTGVDAFGISLQSSIALARNNQISNVFAAIGTSYGIVSNSSNAVLIGNQIDTCVNGITVVGSTGETKYQSTLIVNVTHPFNGGTDAGHNN